jgi:hypothetical protein
MRYYAVTHCVDLKRHLKEKQMGRPLNKKFFGNRNIGTTGTTDDYGIGGQGVASVTIGGTNNDYIAVPTVTFAAPTLPGGVTATAGAITMVVKSVAITNAGGSYLDEEVVELGSGSAAGGTGTVDGTYTTRASFRIKSIDGGGGATSIELVNGGSYTVLAYNGATAVSNPGSTVTEMFTTGGTGNNLRVTITWGVLSVPISEKGSGYVSAPAITMTGNATKVAVLTTDTGTTVGVTENQENAISITAWVPGTSDAGRISGNGTSAVVGDIVRQCGSDKYIVTTAQGTGRVTLQTTAADAAGEANITATDYSGTTYYVTRVTAHKARITPYGAGTHEFPLVNGVGQVVPWTFDTLVVGDTGVRVRINNA